MQIRSSHLIGAVPGSPGQSAGFLPRMTFRFRYVGSIHERVFVAVLFEPTQQNPWRHSASLSLDSSGASTIIRENLI